ncbi:branched-chain amino acid ABC transporter ATP-binding protein/permease [Nocardioides dongxiaopingii]|uniref:branched-chain amino acid ABC transporter ATP-binding protein/permease n=1 Tax=Nocardioides TaxID=1839 RepID=UPI0010C76424|nr:MULTISPECIES: branched-chain amino acid ABC transporter ATP-binding protein/permease [Nocardioides]QCW49616.2 branched-chain amino acid ABC transporter ATP-binding protein/permease [Nocardioides sp. S-1144]
MSTVEKDPPRTGGRRKAGPGVADRGTHVRSALRRDVLFAVAALAIAIIVILPGRNGEGTSISTMQLVASMAAMTVAAVGLNLLVGYTKLVSLGQGGFYAIGAYGSAYLALDKGWHPVLAILGALALCGLVGAVTAMASMRLRGPQFSVITLVMAVLVERILNEGNAFGRLAGYPNFAQHGTTVTEPITFLGITFTPPMIAGEVATVMVPIVVVTALVVILSRNIARSPWGASLSAIGESEMLASHLGVHVFRRKVAVFVLASVLGGLGGVMATQAFSHLQPETFDIFLTITIVLAVVFGGSGTVLGPVVGAVAIVWLEQSDILVEASQWQQDTISDSWFLSTSGLVGVLFLLTLFLMPRGIVGTAGAVVAARLHRRDAAEADGAGGLDEAGDEPAEDLSPVVHERPAPGSLLTLTDMGKRFGGLQAVAELDLSVDRGQIHAIIGPNGAGKSTLANLVTGVYKPSSGQVTFAGNDLTGQAPHSVSRAGIARTFQTPQLFHDATVRDNVLAGFADTGRTPLWAAALKPPSRYRRDAEMRVESDRLLALVGLEDVPDVRASELPYGKQRALEIARALAGGPELIVLDEPAAGLLATETSGLGDLLMSLRDQGYALVVVEHHMDLVSRIADQVTCMDQGRLLARGTPQEVLSDERVIAAYLGKPLDEHGHAIQTPDSTTTPGSTGGDPS